MEFCVFFQAAYPVEARPAQRRPTAGGKPASARERETYEDWKVTREKE